MPRRVVIHDDLPKTDDAKLDKLAPTALDAAADAAARGP